MALYDTNKNLIAGSRKTNIYRCNSFAEYEALPAAEKAKYDYVATPEDEVKTISNPFTVNTGKVTDAYEIKALKQGRVVQFKVYIESFKNIASETWNTLGTVVDAIKPAMETPLSMSDGRVINATALSRITPNGEMQIWGTDALNTLSSRFSATYFSAE